MPASHSKIPIDVVVDTWNLRRQAKDVLGSNRFPSMEGIRAHLSTLGFDVKRAYAAVACEAYTDTPSARVAQALKTSESFVGSVERCNFGSLLKGRLTDRSGQLEEKLVDVLCAVQISRSAMEIVTRACDSRAIVVISEDIDLTPAYEFARSLGVVVYAMANETVHTRPGDWIVLGDAAMEQMCGRPANTTGYELKSTIAKQLLSGTTKRKYNFRYKNNKSGDLIFRHRSGVEVAIEAKEIDRFMKPGEVLELYPAEALVLPGEFPTIRASTSPPPGDRAPHVIDATVTGWIQPTRVRVLADDSLTRTLEAAPGTLFPGMRVAILAKPGSRPRLIGALESLPKLESWANTTAPKLATVLKSAPIPGGTATASVPGLAKPVALLPPSGVTPQAGDVFAVVPRDQAGGRITKVIAISTPFCI